MAAHEKIIEDQKMYKCEISHFKHQKQIVTAKGCLPQEKC